MRIGEFAEICETKISILRHYDKEGLLLPHFIDQFTGYRYYCADQVMNFNKITALKKASFSLKEIRNIIENSDNTSLILDSISEKQSQLMKLFSSLEEAKTIMLGTQSMHDTVITEDENGTTLRLSVKNPIEDFHKSCEQLEEAAKKLNYQRISGFKTYGEPYSNYINIVIDVIKLDHNFKTLNENIHIPFENDDVVGKWEVVGDFAVKEDFFAGMNNCETSYGDINKQIYFLPEGEKYWCYGWTKGLLILDNGRSTSLNSYSIEDYNGERYMFIQNKSYYYLRGGRATILVLRQLDHNLYTRDGIGRQDNINMPFINDESVLGKWKSISYLRSIEEFIPDKRDDENWLYFKEIEFLENGKCISIYGQETISGNHSQLWTKGYVLRKWDSSACAYEIHSIDDIDYLIIEWKSGDYRWGGFDTDYYAFIRV